MDFQGLCEFTGGYIHICRIYNMIIFYIYNDYILCNITCVYIYISHYYNIHDPFRSLAMASQALAMAPSQDLCPLATGRGVDALCPWIDYIYIYLIYSNPEKRIKLE